MNAQDSLVPVISSKIISAFFINLFPVSYKVSFPNTMTPSKFFLFLTFLLFITYVQHFISCSISCSALNYFLFHAYNLALHLYYKLFVEEICLIVS